MNLRSNQVIMKVSEGSAAVPGIFYCCKRGAFFQISKKVENSLRIVWLTSTGFKDRNKVLVLRRGRPDKRVR